MHLLVQFDFIFFTLVGIVLPFSKISKINVAYKSRKNLKIYTFTLRQFDYKQQERTFNF